MKKYILYKDGLKLGKFTNWRELWQALDNENDELIFITITHLKVKEDKENGTKTTESKDSNS
jgi:hypothetical protein